MKKALFVIGLALIASVQANAQFFYGFKGGLNLVDNNITNINRGNAISPDRYKGFFIGPSAEYHFEEGGVSIELASLFSQKGLAVMSDENVRERALAFPFTLKYGVGMTNLSVFAQGGVQFNYNIGDLETFIKNTSFTDETKYEVTQFIMDKSSWSINLGAGARILQRLQLTANYNIPITQSGTVKVQDNLSEAEAGNLVDKAETIEDAKARVKYGFKTKTLQLSLTYYFKSGK